jgi:hypothetical protein
MTAADASRTSGEVAREQALGYVSDVLFNLDAAIARAKKGAKAVTSAGDEQRNVELALLEFGEAARQVRKRLVQDTYYAEQPRLL